MGGPKQPRHRSGEIALPAHQAKATIFGDLIDLHVKDMHDVGKRPIDGLHFHDLRHEGASRLFEAGLSIEQVALVTGHKDWKMLRRYANLRPEQLHRLPNAPLVGETQKNARRPTLRQGFSTEKPKADPHHRHA
jgi:Phage integrase family